MKKSFLTVCSLIVANALSAQIAQDALLFSTSNYFLTARQTAMGGASGALTSDMGGIAVNPAILGTYRTSELAFTPLYYNIHSASDYLGSVTSDSRAGVAVGQAGVVYSLQPVRSEQRYNIAFTYNRLNNLNSNSFADGNLAVASSLWQEWAKHLNSSGPNDAFKSWAQQAADQGQLFILNNNGQYRPSATGEIIQDSRIDRSGNIGEYALSFGTNLGDMVTVGASLVLRDAFLHTTAVMTETDADHLAYYNRIEEINNVSGLGVGGKLGVTVTPLEDFVVGGAIHTPLYYSLERYSQTYIKAYSNNTPYNNVYSSGETRLNYSLLTPLQFSISASYIIEQYVLVAVDYEMTPYTMAKLSNSSGPNLDSANEVIDGSSFGSQVRLGIEGYIYEGFVARTGFGYRNGLNEYNKSSFNVGGGLGYRFGEASVDLTYTYQRSTLEYPLYSTAPTNVTNTIGAHHLNLSLSYRF